MLQEKFYNGVRILSINKIKLENRLEKTIKKIIKNKNILKIILFGSFSKGNYKPDSDIDIAIILKNTPDKFIERQDKFIDFFIDFQIDVNIIVYTIYEFNKMLNEGNNFIKEINEGRILYENPNP